MYVTLPTQKFDIIYADPPWDYRGRKQFGFAGDVGVDSGGAIRHYPTLTVSELSQLPIVTIAEKDCLLYLWTTGPMVVDAIKVLEAWGFQFATVAFVWNKVRTNPGYYTLSQAEFVFVGKRGRIPQPRGLRNVFQWFTSYEETQLAETEVLEELRTKHSRKPAEIRRRIEQMHPHQKKIELFARETVPGWKSWGNEVLYDAS